MLDELHARVVGETRKRCDGSLEVLDTVGQGQVGAHALRGRSGRPPSRAMQNASDAVVRPAATT